MNSNEKRIFISLVRKSLLNDIVHPTQSALKPQHDATDLIRVHSRFIRGSFAVHQIRTAKRLIRNPTATRCLQADSRPFAVHSRFIRGSFAVHQIRTAKRLIRNPTATRCLRSDSRPFAVHLIRTVKRLIRAGSHTASRHVDQTISDQQDAEAPCSARHHSPHSER